MAEFYSARGWEIPPLPWTNLSPPFSIDIRVREIPHQGLFKSFRICPNCERSFRVDIDTKCRQAACLVIAVISLAFTILLYFLGSEWLTPTLVSYVALGLLIYWGNRQLFFVPYKKGPDSIDGT